MRKRKFKESGVVYGEFRSKHKDTTATLKVARWKNGEISVWIDKFPAIVLKEEEFINKLKSLPINNV